MIETENLLDIMILELTLCKVEHLMMFVEDYTNWLQMGADNYKGGLNFEDWRECFPL